VHHFDVRLWEDSSEIHLTVSDVGAGFDTDAAMKGTGLGLTSMNERLKLVNGELTITSQPNRGTTVHARVPVAASYDTVAHQSNTDAFVVKVKNHS
jgi:signal transduction histidine kinase